MHCVSKKTALLEELDKCALGLVGFRDGFRVGFWARVRIGVRAEESAIAQNATSMP